MIINMDKNTQEEKPVESQKSTEVKVDAPAAPSTQTTAPTVQYGDEDEEEKKQIHLQGEKVKSGDEDETLIYIKKAKVY